MKATPVLICLLLLGVPANPVWATNVSPIDSLGNATYTVTVKATHKFTRNTDKLKAEAEQAAADFCAKDGKVLKVVSVDQSKSMYMMGDFAQVTLTFRALTPGDPVIAQSVAIPEKPTVLPSAGTEQLYADLLRLDELRKKGILTDAEFDVEKKEILERSK